MVAALKHDSTTPDPIQSSSLAFRAGKKELQRALDTLARVSDRKSSMPMLANVLIRVTDIGTMLVATDLNVYATLRAPAWAGTPGGITVNAKSLADLVKKLPGDEVALSKSGMLRLRVASGTVDTTLIGMHDRDYPKIPDGLASGAVFHTVNAETLSDMIERTLHSVCQDETRFHLNGITFECDGTTARMISTDGHRLTKIAAELAGPSLKTGVIIPAKAAKEIARLLGKGTCEIAVKMPYLHVRYAGWEFSVKLIDAQFPPYEQVIPKGTEKLVTLERKPFLEALKRAKQLTSETRGVRFDVANGKLTLSSDNPDTGTASEVLTAESQWCDDGGKLVIGFSPKYMIDLVSQIDCERVTLAFGADLDPIVVRSTEHAVSYTVQGAPYLGVIMPMRI